MLENHPSPRQTACRQQASPAESCGRHLRIVKGSRCEFSVKCCITTTDRRANQNPIFMNGCHRRSLGKWIFILFFGSCVSPCLVTGRGQFSPSQIPHGHMTLFYQMKCQYITVEFIPSNYQARQFMCRLLKGVSDGISQRFWEAHVSACV